MYQMTIDLGDIVLENEKKLWWDELCEYGCNAGYGYILLLLISFVSLTANWKRKI
jgi:hypothetical protein